MKIFLLIALILSGPEVAACTVGFGDFDYLDRESTHIFCGTVIGVQMMPDSRQYSFATVALREVWRGDLPDTVVVASDNSSCGASFKPDHEYVFFPRHPGDKAIGDWAEGSLDPAIWRGGQPLSVWTGSCASYERAGEATFITFGEPNYVANGQKTRNAKSDELLDLLENPHTPNLVYVIRTLSLCKARLIADTKSGAPEGQARLTRMVDSLLQIGLENREKEPQVYRSALYAVGGLDSWAEFALPHLISLYDQSYSESFDDAYWYTLSRIGKNDPALGEMLIRVADTSSVEEIRAYALGQFWYGNIPWQDGAHQPDEFIMDPAAMVRLLATKTLVSQTSAPDSLAFLARLVLADDDTNVTKQVLPVIFSQLDEYIPTRCSLMKATMESPHEDVRKTGTRYWDRLGGDCP